MSFPKRYLGDGVFIEYDGDALVLTTSDGKHDTNRIVLYPGVHTALVAYVNDVVDAGGVTVESKS